MILQWWKDNRSSYRSERGIALLVVVSVLAIMASLAIAFLVAARLESVKAVNFKEGMKANSIADAGVEHAKALLREDKDGNEYDDYSEAWRQTFAGEDVDNDGDGTPEAQWIALTDAAGSVYGRYAVTVEDEAGKINLNTAGYYNEDPLGVTEGWTPFEVSLNKCFEALGCSRPEHMRDAIITARYGGNVPGVADVSVDDNGNAITLGSDRIDNNADGQIDEAGEGINEPLEFVIRQPYGDDAPFITIDDVAKLPDVRAEMDRIERYCTVYSADKNISRKGYIRYELNHIDANELMNVLRDEGVADAEQVAANIIDYRDRDSVQTVLVSQNGTFYGVEGVRINELMVRPIHSFNASDHTNSAGPGGNWQDQDTYFTNSMPEINGVGGVWWFDDVPPGTYYLRVFGTSSGQIVGDVNVGGTTQVHMQHGEQFIAPVTVGADGRFRIRICNAEVDQPGFTTYFARCELSQQPDGEYVELLNITDRVIDVSNWLLEGLRGGSLVASVPAGTTIPAFGYCVLAVDADDNNSDISVPLKGNGISFESIWSAGPVDMARVVQLIPSDTIKASDDLLPDLPSVDPAVLVLKDAAGQIVDRATYGDAHVLAYRALERDDPASQASSNTSRIFDQWNASDGMGTAVPRGTPSVVNNNVNVSGHRIGGTQTEVKVKDRDCASVGEIAVCSAGASWQRVSVAALGTLSDLLCVQSIRLEAEGHEVAGSMAGWRSMTRSEPDTDWFVSTEPGDEGTWLFTADDRIPNGVYKLIVYGYVNEAISIAVRRADDTWSANSPPLVPNIQNAVYFGLVDIGGDSADATPSHSLEIKIQNASSIGKASVDCIVLSPVPVVPGRININTASAPVLRALPGVTDEIASRIIAATGRPFKSIGDLVTTETLATDEETRKNLFRPLTNLITVRSDTYAILVTAEVLRNGKQTATRKVRVNVER